jgi:hypothetical protein
MSGAPRSLRPKGWEVYGARQKLFPSVHFDVELFTELSSPVLQGAEFQVDRRMKNWKGFEWKRSWSNQDTLTEFSSRDSGIQLLSLYGERYRWVDTIVNSFFVDLHCTLLSQ